jgi:hypothetical protein
MRSSLLYRFSLLAFLIVPACSAQAQDAASAKTFLQSIYALYHKGGSGIDVTGPRAGLYLHSSLIALLRDDARAVGPGEVGVLDGDPLCGCQDWDGIFALKIDVHEPKAGKAEALVSFALFKDAKPQDVRSLLITLAVEKGAWRVWNVMDRSDAKAEFDLREALEKEIRGISKSKPRR